MNKNKMIRISIFGLVVLAFGLFLGYQSRYIDSAYIRDRLYTAVGLSTRPNASDNNATRSNATRSNATRSNATRSNATNNNATNNNATNNNATNSNASDGILYLLYFALDSDTVNIGEQMPVHYDVSGAHTIGTTVFFTNDAGDLTFSVPVESIASNPYITIPTSVVPSKYNVSGVLLTGRNSDGTTFTKQFSVNRDNGSSYFQFNSSLTINGSQFNILESVKLNSISFNSKSAKLGDKVYVNLNYTGNVKKIKLTLTNSSNKQFTAYVKSLNNKPYFEIPSTTTSDIYKLTGVVIESDKGTVSYDVNEKEGTVKYDFNSEIEIKGANDNTYLYNNEDLTNEIIARLYKLGNGVEIYVNADTKSLINSELFNAIKGKRKKLIINYGDNQVIFNGEDITDPKSIDALITLGNVKDNSDINNYVTNGILINFADNGFLPGKALVRIKSTSEMNAILKEKSKHVYYYNNLDDNFSEIATNIEETKDGYYEFEITHNSSYIIVNNKLDSSIVVSDLSTEDYVTWEKSSKVYILLILAAVVLIAIVSAIIIYAKKKNKVVSDNKEEVKDEKKEEEKDEIKEETKDDKKDDSKSKKDNKKEKFKIKSIDEVEDKDK